MIWGVRGMLVVYAFLLVWVAAVVVVVFGWRPGDRARERERRGRNRAHSLGRRGDPNDLAPWDRL